MTTVKPVAVVVLFQLTGSLLSGRPRGLADG
jgi:hypothetical protein